MIKDALPEISIILPCKNEQEALPFCLAQIKKTTRENNLDAEIIVSDSSTDKSPEIAKRENVILVKHDKNGYGIAYLEAFKIAKGKYIFMADADGTYDFNEISRFIKFLRDGYDFVIGDRFSGKMEKGAMPYSHKLGNPLLSGTLRLFFGTTIKDSHCGMRAISKNALQKLNLQTTGMEFASEMVIKSIKHKLKIKELSINYYKRKGKSKLKTFPDAWKHLRFMLLYSPLFLFFIPGFLMMSAGAILMPIFYFSDNAFFSSLLIIAGYQLIIFSLFAKTYSITHLKEKSEIMDKIYKYLTIERASILGFSVILFGTLFYFLLPKTWSISMVVFTLIVIGIQTIFSSFMLSILSIKEK
jgi:glycosyltransferase involved in cell wall biosynthesis